MRAVLRSLVDLTYKGFPRQTHKDSPHRQHPLLGSTLSLLGTPGSVIQPKNHPGFYSMQQQSATSFGFARAKDSEETRYEQEVLSKLQWAISRAADAILLKDDPERRRVLIADAHSAYEGALQLMIQRPAMTSAPVQRNRAHLDVLLRRLAENNWHPDKFRSNSERCDVCSGNARART